MNSQKPYLIRAIYEWLLDNHTTPYLLVDTTIEGVQVPTEFIDNGRIILNIEPNAVNQFHADNEWISFSARFSGRAMELFVPIHAVMAIYAKENNEGLFFTTEHNDQPPPPKPSLTDKDAKPTGKGKPGLKLVK